MHSVRILMPLVVLTLLTLTGFSQDRILMMSGSVLECRVTSTDDVFVMYERTKRNGKVQQSSVSRYEVFSIIYADGREEVIYQTDFIQKTEYTEDEMRAYIAGSQDAYKNHKAKFSFWGGIGVGLVAGYLGEGNVFVTFGTPVVFSGAHYVPNIRIREEYMSDLDYKFNNNYALGYERVARSRMMLRGLGGSALGSAIGSIGYFIQTAND